MTEDVVNLIAQIEAQSQGILDAARGKAAEIILASKEEIGKIKAEALPVDDVKKDCEKIVDGAEQEAEKIINEAKKKADGMKKAASAKIDKIVEKVANTIVGKE